MAYTDDNPPASPQYREPRREAQSGIVFVHTAEGVMDDVGPDTGAENVAAFIVRRTDPGSYHELVDSDSFVSVVRDECEAFQVAAGGHNRHGWGISFACRTTDLDPDSEWTRKAMAIAGRRIAAYWQRRGINPAQAARWLSKDDADARRGPGLCCHGTVQPADRTDAWTTHPRRDELERLLVASILGTTPPTPTPAPEDDVYAYNTATHKGRGQLWLLYGPANQPPIYKKWLRNSTEVGIAIGMYGAGDLGVQDALIDFIPTLEEAPAAPTAIDVDALAAALADKLGDQAKNTADEIARRLVS